MSGSLLDREEAFVSSREKSMCKGPVTEESKVSTKTWKKTREGGAESREWGKTTGKRRRNTTREPKEYAKTFLKLFCKNKRDTLDQFAARK